MIPLSMFRRVASIVSVSLLTAFLGACTEQAAISSYFEESQSIAERMVQTGTDFEAIMGAQDSPFAWSDETVQRLDAVRASMDSLHKEASNMSVPEAFVDVHPLLVQSLENMVQAIDIISGIAKDPSTASVQLAKDMTAKAQEGEQLANEYVTALERVLTEKYPEMIQG